MLKGISLKKDCIRRKSFRVVIISTIIVSIICSFSIVSFANEASVNEERKKLDIKYEYPYKMGEYTFGSPVNNILNGGKKLEINEEGKFLISDNGELKNLEYHYYSGGFLGLFPKMKKLSLVEGAKDIKNINLLDKPKDKLDDTVYYTSEGIAMYVNVKNLNGGKIEKLQDKHINMMYLINASTLLCMTNNEVFKYDIRTESIENVDMYSSAYAFIPTPNGMIYFAEDDKGIDIFVNNNSIRTIIETMNNNNCENFAILEIKEGNVFFTVDIPGTDTEIPRTLNYGISLQDLFGQLKESSFWISYNSEYADTYQFDGTLDFTQAKDIIIANAIYGNTFENIVSEGTTLEVGYGNSLSVNDINLEYCNSEGDSIVLTKDKDIKELNIAKTSEGVLIYYTSNGVLKTLNMSNGKKSIVNGFENKSIEKVFMINNTSLYYVEDNMIYMYNLDKCETVQIEQLQDNYFPSSLGILHFTTDEEGNEQIFANGQDIYSILKQAVPNDPTINGYTLKKDVISFEVDITQGEETDTLEYAIHYNDVFNNPSIESFVRIDEDESYNFIDEYGPLNFMNTNRHFSAGYELGNKVSNIMNNGTELDLGDGGSICYDGENITYDGEANENTVIITSVRKAKNLNIINNENTNTLVYTVRNKIKAIDLHTGERYTYVVEQGDIEYMYVINEDDIVYHINGQTKRYDGNNIYEESESTNANIIGFAPIARGKVNSRYTYVYFYENDFEVLGVSAKTKLAEIASWSNVGTNEYEISSYGTDNEYLYVYMTANEEEKTYRIKYTDLYSNSFSSDSISVSELFDEFSEYGWPVEQLTDNIDMEQIFNNTNINDSSYWTSVGAIYNNEAYEYCFSEDIRIKYEEGKLLFCYVDEAYKEDIGSQEKYYMIYDYQSSKTDDSEIIEELEINISNMIYYKNALYYIENFVIVKYDFSTRRKETIVQAKIEEINDGIDDFSDQMTDNTFDEEFNEEFNEDFSDEFVDETVEITKFYILKDDTLLYLSNGTVYRTKINGGSGEKYNESINLGYINTFIATNEGNVYFITNSEGSISTGIDVSYSGDLLYVGQQNTTVDLLNNLHSDDWNVKVFQGISRIEFIEDSVYITVITDDVESTYKLARNMLFSFKNFGFLEKIN